MKEEVLTGHGGSEDSENDKGLHFEIGRIEFLWKECGSSGDEMKDWPANECECQVEEVDRKIYERRLSEQLSGEVTG